MNIRVSFRQKEERTRVAFHPSLRERLFGRKARRSNAVVSVNADRYDNRFGDARFAPLYSTLTDFFAAHTAPGGPWYRP